MPLPTQLDKSPLLEAVTELRFKPRVAPDAVLGIILAQLDQSNIESVEELPTAQIPSQLRQHDPNLRYSATHKIIFKNKSIILLIGPQVFSISNIKNYLGWGNLKVQVHSLLTQTNLHEKVSEWHGFSMRYINFFEGDIFEKSTLTLNIDSEQITGKKLFKNDFAHKGLHISFTVTNNARLDFEKKFGSIIDISTKLDRNHISTIPHEINRVLEESHDIIKVTFFKLLKENFVHALEPRY